MELPVSWQQRALALANAANNLIDLKNERLSSETQPPGRLPGDPSMTIGDPDGDRSRQSLTAPRWGGLLIAGVASPLSIVLMRRRRSRLTRVPNSQLSLFDFG
jgi:hypothetical protein